MAHPGLSRRCFSQQTVATSWEEIWEAGTYYDRLSSLMEEAHEWIVLVGWQIDSRLPMGTPENQETLKEKLIRLCERRPSLQIYLLIWDHAYFYVWEREFFQGRVWENIHPRVHFVFDGRHPLGASHHEKICLIDGKVGICGGIDLCDGRWDTPAHLHLDPRRSLSRKKESHGPYHDLAVQVSGPICQQLQHHVARRWRKISTIPFPEPAPQDALHGSPFSGHHVYFSRTVAPIDLKPGQTRMVREVEFLYRELLSKARRRLILEGQYYWSEKFNDLLITKIHEMAGRDFEVVLILADLRKVKSLTRIMTHYELRLLEKLVQASQYTGVRLILGTPYSYSPKSKARAVYVHSKALVVDEAYLSIGSANFAARAFRLDSEINLTLVAQTQSERRHIRRFGEKILSHWNVGAGRKHRAVELRQLNPALLRSIRRSRKWIAPPEPDYTWIRWNRYFDPKMSWLFPLKRKFQTPGALTTKVHLLVTFGSALLVVLLSVPLSAEPRTFFWAIAYALLMSWFLPIPFLPVAAVATLHLPAGLRLSLFSFWMISACGYVGARMFPTQTARRFPRALSSWFSDRFGSRRFSSLLAICFDPRVGLRTKIASQGLYCIPLPWFLLIHGLLLPSVLYGALQLLILAFDCIRAASYV